MAKKSKPIPPAAYFGDEFSFYMLGKKLVKRRKAGFTTKALKTDDRYTECRNNSDEFGHVSTFGKKLRDALEPFIQRASDRTVSSRLTGMLHKVKELDAAPKGQRTVTGGLRQAQSRKLLCAFNWWREDDWTPCRYHSDLHQLELKGAHLNSTCAQITLRKIFPECDGRLPFTDSNFTVQLPCARVDFPDEVWSTADDGVLLEAVAVQFADDDGLVWKTSIATG